MAVHRLLPVLVLLRIAQSGRLDNNADDDHDADAVEPLHLDDADPKLNNLADQSSEVEETMINRKVNPSSHLEIASNNQRSSVTKKGALIVVDMQKEFADEEGQLQVGALHTAKHLTIKTLRRNINLLIAEAWDSVVFTLQTHPRDHISFVNGTRESFESIDLEYSIVAPATTVFQSLTLAGKPGHARIDFATARDVDVVKDHRTLKHRQMVFTPHCIACTPGHAFSSHIKPQPEIICNHDHEIEYEHLGRLKLKQNTPLNWHVVAYGFTASQDSSGPFETDLDTIMFENQPPNTKRQRYGENGLGQLLDADKIDHVYIVGVALDSGVKHTAMQALARGFKVTVVTDATTPIKLFDTSAVFADLDDRIQKTTTDELVASIFPKFQKWHNIEVGGFGNSGTFKKY